MKPGKYGQINDMPGFISKYEPKWHKAIYCMWRNMWERVYNDINYFGKTIQSDYKFLSKYVNDIMKLDNFELFKDDPKGWVIDKDIKGGSLEGYYFEFLSLVSRSDNSKEFAVRCGMPVSKPKRPIIGISNNNIKLYLSISDAVRDGFHISCLTSCLRRRNKYRHTHKGYKWKYINYNHSKKLRFINS